MNERKKFTIDWARPMVKVNDFMQYGKLTNEPSPEKFTGSKDYMVVMDEASDLKPDMTLDFSRIKPGSVSSASIGAATIDSMEINFKHLEEAGKVYADLAEARRKIQMQKVSHELEKRKLESDIVYLKSQLSKAQQELEELRDSQRKDIDAYGSW